MEQMYSYNSVIYSRSEIVECSCTMFKLSKLKFEYWWEYLPNPGFPVIYSESSKNSIRVLGEPIDYQNRKFADINLMDDNSLVISLNGKVDYEVDKGLFHVLYRIAKRIGINPNVVSSFDIPKIKSFKYYNEVFNN